MIATQTLFATWKTIELGTGLMNLRGVREAMENINDSPARRGKPNLRISDNGRETLKRTTFPPLFRPIRVPLVKVSRRQLGFGNGSNTCGEIFTRAADYGLLKCDKEVGPQLRLQYLDQPKEERLVIGMDPLHGGVFQDIFLVDRTGSGLFLRAVSGRPSVIWDDEFEWIFMLNQR